MRNSIKPKFLKHILLYILLLSSQSFFAQQIEIKNLSIKSGKSGQELTYEIKIFNYSSNFLCLPVSTSFSNSSIGDTVELALREENDDKINYVALSLSLEDVKSGFNDHTLFPIVVGPKATAVFLIKFELPTIKKNVSFELEYCSQSDIDFCDLLKKYNIEKSWAKGLVFTSKRFDLSLHD